MIAVVALTIILIAVVVTTSGQTDYAVLYSGLDATDAGDIYAALQEMQVDVQAGANNTIMVPSKDVESIKLDLMSQGLPANSPNAFSYGSYYVQNASGSFGATDKDKERIAVFDQEMTLMNMINRMEKVKTSTVGLYIVADSLYAVSDDAQKESSASIVVEVQPGQNFTDEDAMAIKKMVAGKTGIPESNVAVMNTSGTVFAGEDIGSGSGAVANQIELENKVSRQLANQLTVLLSPVFGAENVQSAVNVKLDFDKKTTESITLEPPTDVGADENKGIIVSMQNMAQRIDQGAGAQGEPGMDTNGGAPTYPEVVEDIEDSLFYEVSEQVNYEVNEVKELIEHQQGNIKDFSATILLNGGDEMAEMVDTVRTMASTAIGVPEERITVSAVPFIGPERMQEELAAQEEAMAALERNQMIRQVVQYGAIAGVIVLILIMVTNTFKKRREMELEAQRLQWMQVQATQQGAHMGSVDLVADEEINFDDILDENKDSTLGQLQHLVHKNPEGIAQILRNWLMDDYNRR